MERAHPLIRLAIWNLRKVWVKNGDINERLSLIASWLTQFGKWHEIEKHLTKAGISYRKTKRAERIEGFDQTTLCNRKLDSAGNPSTAAALV